MIVLHYIIILLYYYINKAFILYIKKKNQHGHKGQDIQCKVSLVLLAGLIVEVRSPLPPSTHTPTIVFFRCCTG